MRVGGNGGRFQDREGHCGRAAASAAEQVASKCASQEGGGSAWGRGRKQAEARKALRLTKEFMEDVGRWRWCLKEGMAGEGERLAALFFRFVS